MMARSEMLGNGTIRRQKPLRAPWRLELLHVLCALAGGVVEILGAIIEIPMLAVLHPRQQIALRCAIAFQLIDDVYRDEVMLRVSWQLRIKPRL